MVNPTSHRFTTKRLTAADAGRLATLLAEPGVRRFLCDDAVLSVAEVDAMIAQGHDLAPQGLGLWELATPDGAPLGCLGLLPVSVSAAAARPDLAGDIEPLIALHEAAWGKAYAGEAMKAALEHAFGTLRLARLVALVDEPNERSHRLLRRVGFAPAGEGNGPRHKLVAYFAQAGWHGRVPVPQAG